MRQEKQTAEHFFGIAGPLTSLKEFSYLRNLMADLRDMRRSMHSSISVIFPQLDTDTACLASM